MLEAYRKHVEERAAQGVPPKPLNAEQVAGLVELLKAPPAGEEAYLLDLISNRVPPGVDEVLCQGQALQALDARPTIPRTRCTADLTQLCVARTRE